MNKPRLLFVTHNRHKLDEIRMLLDDYYQVISLDDLDFHDEIEETEDTLEGNALLKARTVYDRFQVDCFADDTGLEVSALSGAPGVFSARYAGEGCTYDDNVNKLLQELDKEDDRKARFRTVIALIKNGQEFFFEGTVDGAIIRDKRGTQGFGYDPVFVADGFSETFAEMPAELKNNISHRGKAVMRLADFLREEAIG